MVAVVSTWRGDRAAGTLLGYASSVSVGGGSVGGGSVGGGSVGGGSVGGDETLRRIEAVTDATLSHLDVRDLLNELLDRVRELLGVDTAAVLLLDPHSQQLIATAARGVEEEVSQGSRIPVGRGFAGRIAGDRRPVSIEKVDHVNVLNPVLRDKGIQSLLGVPMMAGGEVVGVLHVGSLTLRRFTEADADFLQVVADRIGLATQARLTGIDRAAALALQRSLLPTRLPDVPGIDSPRGMFRDTT